MSCISWLTYFRYPVLPVVRIFLNTDGHTLTVRDGNVKTMVRVAEATRTILTHPGCLSKIATET